MLYLRVESGLRVYAMSTQKKKTKKNNHMNDKLRPAFVCAKTDGHVLMKQGKRADVCVGMKRASLPNSHELTLLSSFRLYQCLLN